MTEPSASSESPPTSSPLSSNSDHGRSTLRWIQQVVATIVRPASVVALTAEVLTLTTTAYPDWANWRRMGLGWRFWTGLGDKSAILAVVCLPLCLFLAYLRHFCGDDESCKKVGWCVIFNLWTMALVLFVPRIAAL